MYQDLDFVTTKRKSRHRMNSQRGPKITLEGNPGGRRKDRPRKRWFDNVQDNMIKMGVKRWTKAMDIGECRKICEAAKVLQEL
jgi:hypothetical protein